MMTQKTVKLPPSRTNRGNCYQTLHLLGHGTLQRTKAQSGTFHSLKNPIFIFSLLLLPLFERMLTHPQMFGALEKSTNSFHQARSVCMRDFLMVRFSS